MVANQSLDSVAAPVQADPPSPNPQAHLGQAANSQTPLLLLAPLGQLSGDGQLRELIQERRGHGAGNHGDGDAQLWYLPPFLLVNLRLGGRNQEGIAALETGVITWLQLRFGGCAGTLALPAGWLQERAGALPPRAPVADTSTNTAPADRT